MTDTPRQDDGRRRPRGAPKGRQVDPKALAEVRALLADRPRRRDLLIEHLHLLQDRHGFLPAAQLAALAAEMKLSLAEVYEVATFYAHFEVATAAPPLTVRVCDSLSCAMAGAQDLLATLQQALGEGVRVIRAPCMGACDSAPVAAVGHRQIRDATVASVAAQAKARGHPRACVPAVSFEAYRAGGGYRLLEACLAGGRSREEVIADVGAAALRGLGGAGFPTARKWSLVRGAPGPRLMCVNADEGEPGTFKDRACLEGDPHRVLEGLLIAAWVVEAAEVYIYLRDEYAPIRLMLEEEIARLRVFGFGAFVAVHLRRGAGAYICGEESAMIESIEGKRGLPRHRPPYVAQAGLFGRPTLVQNVETLSWVRDILERGPAWYADQGVRGAKGLRSFSVSGRVRRPGVKRAPAGITARELIDRHCGGMAEGHAFAAYLPGGASGGILPAALADLPLDFGSLDSVGAFVGSHALIVLSHRDDVKAVALNLLRFFADESCGKCTPCRVGTQKAAMLMAAHPWDAATLKALGEVMADASICGLGQAAPNPLLSVLRHFPEALNTPLGGW